MDNGIIGNFIIGGINIAIGIVNVIFFYRSIHKRCPLCGTNLKAIENHKIDKGIKFKNISNPEIPNKNIVTFKCPKCAFTTEEIH